MNQRPPTKNFEGGATKWPLPPGKVIAVHLSYTSRAQERGRRPDNLSYFLKPLSSLSGTNEAVERPEGTELLAFEGEIALVIGKPARYVSVAEAWDFVGWVTAANDWGLYDLRSADKGSNLRNKGRDGYTPVGPEFIDARTVGPEQLRVRTWRNGELMQSDTSAAMIFPLPQIVADLSQHFTLAPGDVILTGTPAGASVAQPGDRIEVEVDAPSVHVSGADASGEAPAPSTGRLVTPVVSGRGDFDPELGVLPKVDDLQREEAWGSRAAAGLPEPAPTPPVLTDELRAKLTAAPVAGLTQELRKRGLNQVCIDGVRTNHPGAKMVGVARTLRFVPAREDLFASHGGGHNAQKRVFDSVAPGEVIVIEARGETGSGTLGDILALRAQVLGAAGIVTDGGVRDYALVAEIGIPVFSQGPHPAVLGRKHVPWDTDITIACGGATIQPGDIIVGDDDGVIVVPPQLAEAVADATLAQETEDEWILGQVRAGHPVKGLFPMNAEWRAKYEAASQAQEVTESER